MKRILTLVVSMAVPLAAMAQDWQDARFFSENEYWGTARTLGMGNAVTAIGGDPGTLTFNPAGSAVAGYSQFVISPGFTFSTTGATGVVVPGNTGAVGLGDNVRANYGRMSLPNVGAIFSLGSNRRAGWKRFSFGFVLNATNNYTGRVTGSGVNEDNTYAASLATSADGFTEAELGTGRWDALNGPYWEDMVGYRSGMFNGIPGQTGHYQAVTEVRDAAGNCWLAAPVYQKTGQQTTGTKHDVVFNFGANYEDRLYLGLNLGFVTLGYSMSEYFQEMPVNGDEFPDIVYTDGTRARFSSLEMKHSYALRGTGLYAKAGVLWRSAGGLRLAAAIQTPTIMNVNARQAYSGEVRLTGKSIAPSSSPEDNWTYRMTLPFRLNLGAAYSIGSAAVLSADYELTNYADVRYGNSDYGSIPAYLENANTAIKQMLGLSHQLRVGVEVKPVPALAVRAGYNLITYGQKNWPGDDWKYTPLTPAEKVSLFKHSASLGLGYTFGAFFLDAAVRARFHPKEYIVPYLYYTAESVLTPEIEFKPVLIDAILTFGWRF